MADKGPVVIAMIPARVGSMRLPKKNLALLAGQPLLAWAITAAKDSGVFKQIVVNGDDRIFETVARQWEADFYLRPPSLGSSTTKSDHVVKDFLSQFSCDILAWVNPTSPLQTGAEIHKAFEYFQREDLDTLITVKNEQVHAVWENKPVNFKMDEMFAQTQDLRPVQTFVYSVMIWRTLTFSKAMEDHGYAMLSGKVGYFPVSRASAIVIKTKEDLLIAQGFLMSRKEILKADVRYFGQT